MANALPLYDRRVHSRVPVRSVAYVALDEGNGGILLDLSEGGMSVHAVVGMVDDLLPHVRLQLSQSKEWAEIGARIAWRGKSRKVAGLQFTDLSEETRKQIRELISREIPAATQLSAPTPKPAPEKPAPAAEPSAPKPEKIKAFPEFPSEHTNSVAAQASASKVVAAKQAPSLTFGPALTYPSKSKPKTVTPATPKAPARVSNRSTAFAILAVAAAVASLFAGWEAGRGGLSKVIERIHALKWPSSVAAEEPAPRMPNLTPVAPEIDHVSTPQPEPGLTPALTPTAVITESADLPEKAARKIPKETPAPTVPKVLKTIASWVPSSPVRAQGARPTDDLAGENAPSVPPVQFADSLSSGPADLRPPVPSSHAAVLTRSTLVRKVDPVYPAFAKASGIEGVVEMKAVIGPSGSVQRVEPVKGQEVLLKAAIEAVRQWRYTPTLLDQKPIEAEVDVILQFRLPHSN